MKSNKQVIEELKEEKAELDGKIDRLKPFVKKLNAESESTDGVQSVSERQLYLLQSQLGSMERYSFWLQGRIMNLEETENGN